MKVHCVQTFICFTRLHEPWVLLSCVSSLLIFPGHGSHMGLVRGSLASGLFVTPSLGSPALLALWFLPWSVGRVCHLLCLLVITPGLGESAPASVVGVGDFSSLKGRGMDTKLSLLTWHLPWRGMMAVSLYVMGSVGLNTHVNTVEQVQWRELELDSPAESLELGDDTLVLWVFSAQSLVC